MQPRYLVTVVSDANSEMLSRGRWWADFLQCELVTKTKKAAVSDPSERLPTGDDLLIVSIGRRTTRILVGEREFYFHPNMAKLRLLNLQRGQEDQFISAAQIVPGSSVLDCTFGLGADAIVAAACSGPNGRVIGLESEPALAALAIEGLARYEDPNFAMIAAMRRITVQNINSADYLRQLPSGSFDIVYFDPMFRHTRQRSSAVDFLRLLGNPTPLTPELLDLAKRVARQRIVIKEARNSRVFAELGISRITGGKYSPVAYGVISV